MSESKVQNIGRLYYVEPNDVYNRLPNGIPHPYEDYCISVDLVVEVGDRNSLGPIGRSRNTEEYRFSSDNGTISFIGGTNGFLTTNFTDIQSANPNQNTNECLGIESINISYESWYVPRVNIRFVDVRGASLMSKQEQGYVETVREEHHTGHHTMKINGGSFFKSLFSFPYPMFKLKVKGFYGKEVTYNLTVEDFQSSFDAENGNFVTDVRFIGYMFGVYTDIPMNYLMVSPYISGVGDKYWKAQCDNGRFKYYGGIPMETYPKLRADITKITPKNNSVDGSDNNYGEKRKRLKAKIDSLTTIKSLINQQLNSLFDGGYVFCLTYKDGEIEKDNPYSLIGITTGDFDAKSAQARKEYQDKIDETISTHNQRYGDNYTSYGFFGIGTSQAKTLRITCGVNGDFEKKVGIDRYKFQTKEDSGYILDTVDEWISKKIVENGYVKQQNVTVCYPIITESDISRFIIPEWVCTIDDKIKKVESEVEDIDEKIKKNRNEKISEKLGFGVSVGNAFNMAFAHMETFMEVFYHYLRQIKTQQDNNARSLDKLMVNVKNTDLPSDFKSSYQVPPFTMFYKDVENDGDGVSNINRTTGKKKVVVWPGDLDAIKGNESVMPEIAFVNKLIEAAKKYKDNEKLEEEIANANLAAFETAETPSNTYIATTPFDLTNDNTANPYAYIPSLSNGNMQWENMMMTFYLRLLYWYCSRSQEPSEKAVTSFARIEAYNMFKANPTIIGSIKNFLNDRENFSKEAFEAEMGNYFGTPSTESNRKAFDIGRGAAEPSQFLIKGSNYTYAWIKDKFPIANVAPAYVDPGNTATCVTIHEIGSEDSTSETDKTNITDYKKLTPDFTKKHVNRISSTKISDESKTYENEILPKLNVKKIAIGNFTKSSDRGRGVVSFVRDSFWDKIFVRETNIFPHEISSDSYVNTPSFSQDSDLIPVYPLFGYPDFYSVFKDLNVSYDKKILAKACVFAFGTPVKYNKGEDTENKSNIIPFYIALKAGALEYFNFLINPENTDPDAKPISDAIRKITGIPKEDKTIPDKTACLEIFKAWATSDFEKIDGAMEIKGRSSDFDVASALTLVIENMRATKRDKVKMKRMFELPELNGVVCDWSFYNEDDNVYIHNAHSLDFPAKPNSEVQDILRSYCNSYIVFTKIDEFKNRKLVLPASMFSTASFGFLNGLLEFYENQLSNKEAITYNDAYDEEKDVDLKISTYLTLKNLYDRWIANMNPDQINRWKLNIDAEDDDSDFSHFKFIDGFYRDISRCVAVNFEHISSMASQMLASTNVNNDATNTKYQGKSLYEFLTSICEKNQMMLLCFPMENEFTNPEGIADMFDVKSYSRMDRRDTSCFVCLYANKPSQHLDIKYDNTEYMYTDDGFNLSNAHGEVLEKNDLIPQLTDITINGYKIPAFGVTYGKQNQSIFKKISVNMQNPQVTEASIAATQFIASRNNEEPNKTAIYGQDLYRIYANYSYTCSVEMMGNAQIMPLTYFQLNNIPLFRGAYLIINIEHNIVAGNMTTKFTGVRMSKYELPLVDDNGIFNDPNISSDSRFGTSNRRINIQVDDAFYDFVNNRQSGNKKYTVTVSDLLWSDTAAKTPDLDNIPQTVGRYSEDRVWDNINTLEYILMDVQKAWVDYCVNHTDEKWAAYDGLYITSGYRCEKLNNLVGGSDSSHHKFGCAADIQVCKYDTSKKQPNSKVSGLHNGSTEDISSDYTAVFFEFFVKYLYATGKKWDQIFIETSKSKGNKWVHFSYKRPNLQPDKEEYRKIVGSITTK